MLSALIQPAQERSSTPLTPSRPRMPDELSVVIAGFREAGRDVAQLWCGRALLGILHEEHGDVVLRLESHGAGPLTVSAVALERALAEARERLASRPPMRSEALEATP